MCVVKANTAMAYHRLKERRGGAWSRCRAIGCLLREREREREGGWGEFEDEGSALVARQGMPVIRVF